MQWGDGVEFGCSGEMEWGLSAVGRSRREGYL